MATLYVIVLDVGEMFKQMDIILTFKMCRYIDIFNASIRGALQNQYDNLFLSRCILFCYVAVVTSTFRLCLGIPTNTPATIFSFSNENNLLNPLTLYSKITCISLPHPIVSFILFSAVL